MTSPLGFQSMLSCFILFSFSFSSPFSLPHPHCLPLSLSLCVSLLPPPTHTHPTLVALISTHCRRVVLPCRAANICSSACSANPPVGERDPLPLYIHSRKRACAAFVAAYMGGHGCVTLFCRNTCVSGVILIMLHSQPPILGERELERERERETLSQHSKQPSNEQSDHCSLQASAALAERRLELQCS